MRRLSYSMTLSLDGFIAGPTGDFSWTAPDEELHRFHNQLTAGLGLHLCGRGLYETMVYWETAEQDPSLPDYGLEFARIWRALPKIVVSSTLSAVEGNTTLRRGQHSDEALRELALELKAQPGREVAVGGAGLASSLARAGLIDDYRLFISPVVVGGGTPFFPPVERPLELELVETRTFGSRVTYLHYVTR